eukprot:scaffold22_cov401-Pavlova_lutheri.AAC.7
MSCIMEMDAPCSEGFGGVHHYALLLGVSGRKATIPGLLHVFLKTVQLSEGVVLLKGFIFFEAMNVPSRSFGHYNQPAQTFRKLKFRVKSKYGNEEYKVFLGTDPTDMHLYMKSPAILFTELPAHSTDLQLHVSGSQRSILLDEVLYKPCQPHMDAPVAFVKHLRTSTRDLHVSAYVELLKVSFRYHQSLGFKKFIVYERPEVILKLLRHSQVHDLLQDGLVIIRWKALERPLETKSSGYDSVLQFYHVALSFWGANVRILLTDLDEFIALPDGKTLSQEVEGCLEQWNGCELQRFGVVEEVGGNAPHDVFDVFNAKYWNANKEAWGLSGIGAPLGGLVPVRPPLKAGKVILNPNTDVFFNIHHCFRCRVSIPARMKLPSSRASLFGLQGISTNGSEGPQGMQNLLELCTSQPRRFSIALPTCVFVVHVQQMLFMRDLEKNRGRLLNQSVSWVHADSKAHTSIRSNQ